MIDTSYFHDVAQWDPLTFYYQPPGEMQPHPSC